MGKCVAYGQSTGQIVMPICIMGNLQDRLSCHMRLWVFCITCCHADKYYGYSAGHVVMQKGIMGILQDML